MTDDQSDPVSQCLRELEQGDKSAVDRLLPHIYSDLRALAGGIFRGANQTLQPTVLVHEAYMRLVKGEREDGFSGKRHFLDVAAMAMRQLLANHAESQRTQKRGGDRKRTLLRSEIVGDANSGGIDLIDLDDALTELASLDERQARIVELRFLAGLTLDETAEILGVSARTVRTDWQMARRWLEVRLEERRGD